MSVVDDVIAEARETTNRVARTFSIATRLLPRDVRDDVYCLYLVFRTLDDLVDEGEPAAADRIAADQHDPYAEKPHLYALGAFAGAFVFAQVLKRITGGDDD